MEDQFDEIFNLHVKGLYFRTQELLLLNDDGRVVNLSSGLPLHSARQVRVRSLERSG